MTDPRALARAVTVLVAVAAVLLPATAAHASLPYDGRGASGWSVQPSDDDGSAVDDGSAWYDGLADSDDGFDDDGAAYDQDAVDDGSDAGSSAPTRAVPRSRPGRPHAVQARSVSAGRATLRWTAGRGAKATRWVVSLQSARTGRIRSVGASSRTVVFTALQPRTRYTATVTAVGAYGTASASTAFRTAAPARHVLKARDRAARDVRVAKAIRFG